MNKPFENNSTKLQFTLNFSWLKPVGIGLIMLVMLTWLFLGVTHKLDRAYQVQGVENKKIQSDKQFWKVSVTSEIEVSKIVGINSYLKETYYLELSNTGDLTIYSKTGQQLPSNGQLYQAFINYLAQDKLEVIFNDKQSN